MCGDARNWNEAQYREAIFKEREIHTRTVFRTAWSPSSRNPNPESIVVASSDGSIASYSLSSCLSNLLQPLAFSKTGGQQVLTPEPDVFVQGHEGPAYDVKFYGDGEDAILLSCGDDGHIRGWRWKEFRANQSKGNHVTTVLDLANPQHKGPWGALSPIPENNALAVDVERKSIYAAAGDSCAYCWDVETGRIKTVFKGHSNYLHCIVARNSSSQIVTSSEDGTARVWDCRSSKCIQVIDPNKDFKMQESSTCVSCIALDASESWLACGSGSTLTVWNLPSSDCIVNISTGAPTQDVLFENNHILEVGAKPVITRFDMNGEILSEVQCAPPSAYSLSLHQSGVIAVGGYGGLIDIISQFGSHLCTFRCECVYGSTV